MGHQWKGSTLLKESLKNTTSSQLASVQKYVGKPYFFTMDPWILIRQEKRIRFRTRTQEYKNLLKDTGTAVPEPAMSWESKSEDPFFTCNLLSLKTKIICHIFKKRDYYYPL